MTMYQFGDAAIDETALDAAFLQREVSIAFGSGPKDMNWRNTTGTLRALIESMCAFERGPKIGRCALQGSVVDTPHGVQRLAANMRSNSIMMFDYDKGESIDEIAQKIAKHSQFAMLWTTHSNLKPETLIPEKKIEAYLRTIGLRGVDATDEHVLEYLKKSAKILDRFLTPDVAKVVERTLMDGGVKYRVSHPPLPRLRALFVLKDPFDFANRAGSQSKAITEWKELYAGVSEMLDLPYDTSCCDPSRLMYTPRIAPDAVIGEHLNEIMIIKGNPLDLSAVPHKPVKTTKEREAPPRNNFQKIGEKESRGRGGVTLKTGYVLTRPWLRKFAALCGKDFEMARWLYSEFPDDVRGSKTGTKIEFKCPNEDGHTEQKTTDTAFFVEDGDGDEHGFYAHCQHTTCIEESGTDRLWYLDRLCEEYDINSIEELWEYVGDAGQVAWVKAEDEEKQKQEEVAAAKRVQEAAVEFKNDTAAGRETPLHAQIARLTNPPIALDLRAVVELVAALDVFEHEALIGRIKLVTGVPKPRLREAVDAARARLQALNIEESVAAHPQEDMTVPTDHSTDAVIWVQESNEWPPETQNDCVAKQLERKNNEGPQPRLYRRPEGGVMRVIVHPDGNLVVGEMDPDAWTHEIGRSIRFKKLTEQGRVRVLDPPAARVRDYMGRADKNLPMLERVVKVPVFSHQGTLITERGYVPDMHVYLDPSFTPLAVSQTPTDADVDMAVNRLADILTDFPFSDAFDGDDPHPIKLVGTAGPVLDADGHALPNPDRGASSFANMLAMILQPFVQHMIAGNSPAFHIDKASPGTGANYLVDVAFCIAEGKRATVRTMSDSNEEFKKAITATLRQGAPIIFIDNINRKVDSGALAAALTSGVWSDRVLGVSEVVDIPVKSVWVMAGNNLTFSGELMRRNVPIRLDASTPNPAQDRGQKDFKYFPLQDHVLKHRAELVQACHVLIANWIARGRPHGTATMNSFDHWARVLGGILEAAGIGGFLANIPAYLDIQNEDDSGLADYAEALWDRFKDAEFTIDMALGVAKNALGVIGFGLPLDPMMKEVQLLKDLGKFLKNQMSGRTFRVTTPETVEGKRVTTPEGTSAPSSPSSPKTLNSPSEGSERSKGDDGDDRLRQVTTVVLVRRKAKDGVKLRLSPRRSGEGDVGDDKNVPSPTP